MAEPRRKVAYHGTPRPEAVLREGLRGDKADGDCSHIWLARDAEEAAHYGTVIEVTLLDPWPEPTADDPDNWQTCAHGGDIGPERLSLWRPVRA